MMHLHLARFASPLGDILLVFDQGGVLRALDFDDCEARMRRLLHRHYGAVAVAPGPAPETVTSPLRAYFDGESGALERMLVGTGGSGFQREVWGVLRTIPVGTTMTYGKLAATLGKPGAARAVGLANGSNPLAIVVPCHRVIGAQDALTGYSGGLERKRWLLAHEKASIAQAQPSLC